jgi:hypothetical protein
MPHHLPARAAALLAALALTACVSVHRSDTLAALPAELAANARIESVAVTHEAQIKVSPEFDAAFAERVKAKLDGCAKGTKPLRLEASIRRLDKANKAVTLVVGGGKNAVRGHATLIDPATGEPVAEYEIGQTVLGTRLATLQMVQPEKQMGEAFGDELCRQAFTPAAATAPPR